MVIVINKVIRFFYAFLPAAINFQSGNMKKLWTFVRARKTLFFSLAYSKDTLPTVYETPA
jgi:hypothetical protein